MDNKDIYFWTGLLSTALFIFKFILMTVGSDQSDVNDWDHSISGWDTAIKLLSIQSVLAFGMGAGWLGYLCLDGHFFSPLITAFFSTGFGCVMGYLSIFVLTKAKGLNSHPKISYPQVGDFVEAYTHIPLEKDGVGKVKFQTVHRVEYYQAAAEDEMVPAFQSAVIVKILKSGILIIKRK